MIELLEELLGPPPDEVRLTVVEDGVQVEMIGLVINYDRGRYLVVTPDNLLRIVPESAATPV